jgi:hypothetical protein
VPAAAPSSRGHDPGQPRAEYLARLNTRRAELLRLAPRERMLGLGRVVLFLTGLTVAGLAIGLDWLSLYWVALPAAAFLIVLFLHDRVNRATRRAERAVVFYERGLARVEDRWIGGGEPGDRFLDPEHPNAADLDLFGRGSLFELLCTARTHTGQETLARWLLHPAAAEVVRSRQEAVRNLRDRLDLREDIAALGSSATVDLAGLIQWAESPRLPHSRALRVLLFALSILAAVTLIGWFAGLSDRLWFLASAVLECLIAGALFPRVSRVLKPIERRGGELAVFAGILGRIERESFTAPALLKLRAALGTGGRPPSRRIMQLVALIDWLNARRNQFFLPFSLVLMWGTQLAFALEAWRATCGQAVARWLDAVGEFEALSALAAYAYENPEHVFPEIVADAPCFSARALGHPLLPRARCVRNDVHLCDGVRLLLVSGSNMSGKSTMLRTIGINAVLAQAGAPVRAEVLRLSSLTVGGTLRIQDSLQAGRSRFYAEITRLKQLLDLAKSNPPLLFLLDEILHGTNSHDRRVGAEAVVRSLLACSAFGLVTTHDLALTHLAEQLGPAALNTHFADQIDGDQIHFDYRMQPGIVQHSNALALMRAVGLEV